MKKFTAIKDAYWRVEICGKNLDIMYWQARTEYETGFYNNSFMQIDDGTSEHAKKSWEEFAKINGITKYEYIK